MTKYVKKPYKLLKAFFVLFLFILPFSSFTDAALPLDLRSFWVSPGFNIAGVSQGDSGKIKLQGGGELSVLYFSPLFYYGIYSDYQTNTSRNYFTLGPEFGVFTGILNGGIDGGVILPISGESNKGIAARLFFSVLQVPIMPYFRYNYFINSQNSIEFGILFKLPLQVH